jgi:hypothetical protein
MSVVIDVTAVIGLAVVMDDDGGGHGFNHRYVKLRAHSSVDVPTCMRSASRQALRSLSSAVALHLKLWCGNLHEDGTESPTEEDQRDRDCGMIPKMKILEMDVRDQQ